MKSLLKQNTSTVVCVTSITLGLLHISLSINCSSDTSKTTTIRTHSILIKYARATCTWNLNLKKRISYTFATLIFSLLLSFI